MTKHIHLTKQIEKIVAPASKSFAQRALFAAALASEPTVIKDLGTSDDTLHIKRIIEQLGFSIVSEKNRTTIKKETHPTSSTLDVGESGLGTRLAVPVLSRFFHEYSVEGKGTLLNRSMDWFSQNLPQTGLKVELSDGKLPLNAKGQLLGGNYSIDGSKSSQYVSGLLMTLPLCDSNSFLEVKDPISTPYIDITLNILADFGIKIDHHNHKTFRIKGNQAYKLANPHYSVEGDFSSAAFWIVYGLLTKGVSIENLNPESVQADKAILEVVEKVGGNFYWYENTLRIEPPITLNPFNFDATHCPDLFPILTVLAAGIHGKSTITGTDRLKNKESDRKSVILQEFSNLALELNSSDNKLFISGTGKLKPGRIDSHNDHRIAMSAAIASILTPSGISISDPNCVSKSYPTFWKTALKI